jgi:polyvinyl alcohol dehydrogenase (cytochrome)
VSTGGSTTGVPQSLTNAVVAFDLNDGKLRWVKQLEAAGGASGGFISSPVLRTLGSGNQIILAGQLSGMVYGLDPDHGGEILWKARGGTAANGVPNTGAGGVAWGLAADYKNLYVADSGRLAQPSNGVGSLTAFDLKTGVVRWNTPAPEVACSWGTENCWHGQSQAVTVMPGGAFSGSLDGHLRVYSTIDGKILWDFDTAKAFQTQNGVHASGGPLDRGGATIVNGNVFVNSGNTLLTFSVGGK